MITEKPLAVILNWNSRKAFRKSTPMRSNTNLRAQRFSHSFSLCRKSSVFGCRITFATACSPRFTQQEKIAFLQHQ
jgi:hypothetical protein